MQVRDCRQNCKKKRGIVPHLLVVEGITIPVIKRKIILYISAEEFQLISFCYKRKKIKSVNHGFLSSVYVFAYLHFKSRKNDLLILSIFLFSTELSSVSQINVKKKKENWFLCGLKIGFLKCISSNRK